MTESFAPASRLDLKVSPQDASWEEFAATCVEAENSGAFSGLWAFDHLAPVASGSPRALGNGSTCFEGWSALAAIAALTHRVRLGLLVTAVPYRAPRVLAKIASTVDHISAGRLEVGLGAGNSPEEAEQFGLEFHTAGRRLDDLDSTCALLRAVLRRDPPPDAPFRLQPPPVQASIPIVVGGKGERRTLPIVAAYADCWNYSRGTPEEFARKRQLLIDLCQQRKRDPKTLRYSVQVRVDAVDTSPGHELAAAYIAAGATDIVLYTQASPSAVGPLADVARALAAT